MTPKEKAEDLIGTFARIKQYGINAMVFENCKKCALIAVDEQIDNAEQCISRFRSRYDMIEVRAWWRKVRDEIEKI